MKQHQMTHKFSEASDKVSPTPVLSASSPDEKAGEAASSSPLTSPPSSEPVSPPYRGEKRPGEDTTGLQPEKRPAILCG